MVEPANLGDGDGGAIQDRQLLSKGEVLGGQGCLADQHRPDSDKNESHNTHERPSRL